MGNDPRNPTAFLHYQCYQNYHARRGVSFRGATAIIDNPEWGELVCESCHQPIRTAHYKPQPTEAMHFL